VLIQKIKLHSSLEWEKCTVFSCNKVWHDCFRLCGSTSQTATSSY